MKHLKDHYDHPMDKLKDVMKALRDPEHGCPWDLEQNFKTIAPYTIEEAYEVADAIERHNMDDLREELGDLILQPVYHAQMASENGDFDIDDVVNGIADKMISRHPHVFGDADAASASDVNAIWDHQKNKEKPKDSALDGVALGLPALLRSQKILKKAMKTGFEWPSVDHVYAKIDEELAEFKEAVESGDQEHMSEELGDILINIVILAQMHGFNAEESLRKANAKFERRFRGLESDLKVKGVNIHDANLEQMTQGWQEQKAKEKASA